MNEHTTENEALVHDDGARTIGQPTAETLALCRLLRSVAVGQVVSYEEMATAVGCTPAEIKTSRRSVYYSARDILLREDRMWFDCQIGVGYKRLNDREKTEMWPREASLIRQRAKKAADVVSSANFEALNPIETRAALTGLAVMGAVRMFVTPRAQKSIASKIDHDGNVGLSVVDTLKLFTTSKQS